MKSPLPLVAAFVTVFLFIGVSYIVQSNTAFLEQAVNNSIEGAALYVAITVLAIVVAPVSSLPLLPLAVGIFGWVGGALLSVVGWFIGATIAFELSRAYGKALLGRFVDIKPVETVTRQIPESYGFFGLVLLRMSVPVDILSYALGLFTTVPRRLYYLSTLVGIIPFAFIFAYVGSLSPILQLSAFLLAGTVIFVGWKTRR